MKDSKKSFGMILSSANRRYRELSENYGYSKKQLSRIFETISLPEKIHRPRAIHLVVDATFFGKKDTKLWGVIVFQKYPNLKIPTTTNCLESHFSHIKDVVRIHRGLSLSAKQKVIHAILLNSSIVLKPKRKE